MIEVRETEVFARWFGELRFFWGPGHRVYFVARGRSLVVFLAGGDKRAQASDIRSALELARSL